MKLEYIVSVSKHGVLLNEDDTQAQLVTSQNVFIVCSYTIITMNKNCMFPAGNTKMTIATMSCSLSNVVQASIKTFYKLHWLNI